MCVIAPKPCSMDHEFLRKSKNFCKEFGFGELKMKCIRGRQGSWFSVGPMVGKTLKECSQSLGSVLTKLSNEFLECQGSVGFFPVIIVHVDSKGKKQVVKCNSNAEARSCNDEMCTDGPHKQTPVTRYFAPKSHNDETDNNEKKECCGNALLCCLTKNELVVQTMNQGGGGGVFKTNEIVISKTVNDIQIVYWMQVQIVVIGNSSEQSLQSGRSLFC